MREKAKEDKTVWNKGIPYEIWMKHVIGAYRKDQEKWAKLYDYSKYLEGEVIRLKNFLFVNGFTDSGDVKDLKPGKVIKEQKAEISHLKQVIKEKDKIVEQALEEKEDLKWRLEELYPVRKYKIKAFKNAERHHKRYIASLQELLDEHGIPYMPLTPLGDLEKEGMENQDENAVRSED